MSIPTIDPSVRYVGTSYLRQLNAETLKAFDGAVVVRDAGDQPLVVIVAYETYLKIQEVAQLKDRAISNALHGPRQKGDKTR